MNEDPLRLLALWALVHETADDAWKAAVARGRESGEFADALAALVAAEKDRLRERLDSGGGPASAAAGDAGMDELRFEVGEVRARLESLEAAVDALRRLLEGRAAGPGKG